MSKFTPGPWVIKKVRTSCGHCYKIGSQEIVDKDYSGAACVYDDNTILNETPHNELEANAHLIAAAPELLEALKLAENLIVLDIVKDDAGILKKIQQALTKAQGGAL